MTVFVCRSQIGLRPVDLYVDSEQSGGSFVASPKGDRRSYVTVGLDFDHWWEVLGILCHEAIEFAMMDVGARYKPNPDFANAQDGYYFACNHNQFSEAVSRASYFINQTHNALARAHRKELTARRATVKKPKRKSKKK